MRVHASLKEDIRLWAWAFAGAVALFGVIVVLGIAPSPFPSVAWGHSSPQDTIVVSHDASAGVLTNHRPTRRAPTALARPYGDASTGRINAVVAAPSQPVAQRRRPSPVEPTQTSDSPTPGGPTKPAPASSPVTAGTPPPALPLPPAPDPASLVPTLPTVTVPPLPDPGTVVPTVPLP